MPHHTAAPLQLCQTYSQLKEAFWHCAAKRFGAWPPLKPSQLKKGCQQYARSIYLAAETHTISCAQASQPESAVLLQLPLLLLLAVAMLIHVLNQRSHAYAIGLLSNCSCPSSTAYPHTKSPPERPTTVNPSSPQEAQKAVPLVTLCRREVPFPGVVLHVVHHHMVQPVRTTGHPVQRGQQVWCDQVEPTAPWCTTSNISSSWWSYIRCCIDNVSSGDASLHHVKDSDRLTLDLTCCCCFLLCAALMPAAGWAVPSYIVACTQLLYAGTVMESCTVPCLCGCSAS